MKNPTAKAKNTIKARKFGLEETNVEILGEKSGLVIFKSIKSEGLVDYYSIEEEAFDKLFEFEFEFELKSLPKLESDRWNSIKSVLKKFS